MLQRRSQKPLPEIVRDMLAQAIDATMATPETEGQKIYRLLRRLAWLAAWKRQYAGLPMDLVDASLVVLAEQLGKR